jgi:hypothetical protein
MIDTLETSKRLRAAGFDEAQAEALVGMVRDAREADLARLATKDDLVLLRRDFEQLRTELRGEMGQLRGELTTQIAQLETRLMLRLGAMIAAGVAFLTAIKFFA